MTYHTHRILLRRRARIGQRHLVPVRPSAAARPLQHLGLNLRRLGAVAAGQRTCRYECESEIGGGLDFPLS